MIYTITIDYFSSCDEYMIKCFSKKTIEKLCLLLKKDRPFYPYMVLLLCMKVHSKFSTMIALSSKCVISYIQRIHNVQCVVHVVAFCTIKSHLYIFVKLFLCFDSDINI